MRYYLIGQRRLTAEEQGMSTPPHRPDVELATFDDLDYMRKHAEDFHHGAYDVRIDRRDPDGTVHAEELIAPPVSAPTPKHLEADAPELDDVESGIIHEATEAAKAAVAGFRVVDTLAPIVDTLALIAPAAEAHEPASEEDSKS